MWPERVVERLVLELSAMHAVRGPLLALSLMTFACGAFGSAPDDEGTNVSESNEHDGAVFDADAADASDALPGAECRRWMACCESAGTTRECNDALANVAATSPLEQESYCKENADALGCK
jgi:hypothetical protein